jgi:hypothetical protein
VNSPEGGRRLFVQSPVWWRQFYRHFRRICLCIHAMLRLPSPSLRPDPDLTVWHLCWLAKKREDRKDGEL